MSTQRELKALSLAAKTPRREVSFLKWHEKRSDTCNPINLSVLAPACPVGRSSRQNVASFKKKRRPPLGGPHPYVVQKISILRSARPKKQWPSGYMATD